jgi:hypothetical protein
MNIQWDHNRYHTKTRKYEKRIKSINEDYDDEDEDTQTEKEIQQV